MMKLFISFISSFKSQFVYANIPIYFQVAGNITISLARQTLYVSKLDMKLNHSYSYKVMFV